MIDNLKKQWIPILLVTSIVSAILYIYNSNSIMMITILSFLTQILLFSFFNIVKRKQSFGVLLYGIALVIVGYISLSVISKNGTMIKFVEWAFSTQTQDKQVLPFLLVCFLIVNFFICSFIYYFTQVIYRSVNVLMVTIIPFGLYVKRYETMSFVYIFILLALYIAVMVHCRQDNNHKTTCIVTDASYKKSILVFILLSIGISIMIPKPNVTPFRKEFIEFIGGALGSVNSTNIYGDFSDGSNVGKNKPTNQILYRVVATEPLYLRRQTFDLYEENRWIYDGNYGGKGSANWNKGKDKINYNQFIDALKMVAAEDRNFARKYQLEEFPEFTENLKRARVTLNNFNSSNILNINNTLAISGLDKKVYGTLNHYIFLEDNTYLNSGDNYNIQYYSEEIDRKNQAIEFSRKFTKETYEMMMLEASAFFYDRNDRKNILLGTLDQYLNVQKEAIKYYEDTYQEPSQKLKELAEIITKGLYSDYDKAKALEEYFIKEGFVYDLEYEPKSGNEGSEYFVFNSKKGSCTSYATAMTLMSRAIGLPSRYVEGFSMDEKESDTTYVVRDTDAHAFTEVFISGYGWMTFDATVSETIQGNESKPMSDTIKVNLSWDEIRTLLLFCISILLLLGISILIYPFMKERCFRIQLKFKNHNAAIFLIHSHMKRRMSQKLGIKTSELTAKMIENKIFNAYNVNIAVITLAFEKVCYGEKMLTKEEMRDSYKTYQVFYKASKGKKSVDK